GGMLYQAGHPIVVLVYSLLFFQVAASCATASLAWRVRTPFTLTFYPRRSSRKIFVVLLAGVLLYTALYLSHFSDKIPLFQLMRGDVLSATVSSRSELTHGFSAEGSPFFAYYRPITKDLLFILLLVLII